MQIAALYMPNPWGYLQQGVLRMDAYAPSDHDRLANLADRHSWSFFPRARDIDWMKREVLLVPEFYRECRRRIEASPAGGRGEENAALMAILTEGSARTIGEIAGWLRAESPESDVSAGVLRAFAAWNRLKAMIVAAFPEAVPLLDLPCDPIHGVDVSGLGATARKMWEFGSVIHPPGLIADIAAVEPRVVLLCGSYPRQLPVAAMYVSRLRGALPRTPMVLYDFGSDIHHSMAQVRDWALKSPGLFDWFDGIPVYGDLADLTLCDLIEHVEHNGDSLAAIENLLCREQGAIRFREPSPERVSRHLARIRLGPDPLAMLSRASTGGFDGPSTARRFAALVAARMACYWGTCRFCPTAAQSWIKHDPHLERRAEETASLLAELADHGSEMSFVGREAIPPHVVTGVVGALRASGRKPCWSYEGRFERFYTPDFVSALAESGCRGIIFGLESPSDRLNDLMGKRRDGLSIEEIERLLDRMDQAGIAVHVNTIFDLPGSTGRDYRRHAHWIRTMFDRHRLFHFNTNRFQLIPGSWLAQNPAAFGLEATRLPEGDFIPVVLPFARRGAGRRIERGSGPIWEEVFGFTSYGGLTLESLHGFYHEMTCLAFWDAARGRNRFKDIQAELKRFSAVGSVRLDLPDSVEMVESTQGGTSSVWLVNVGGPGGWVRLSLRFWQLLERCIEGGIPLDDALDAQCPPVARAVKNKARRTAGALLANGLITLRDTSR